MVLKIKLILLLTFCFTVCFGDVTITKTASDIDVEFSGTHHHYTPNSIYVTYGGSGNYSIYTRTSQLVVTDSYTATTNGTTSTVFSDLNSVALYVQGYGMPLSYPSPPTPQTITDYYLGDSITWGAFGSLTDPVNHNCWAERVSAHFGHAINNLGVPGDQLNGLNPALLPTFDPAIHGWLFIGYGTNDFNNRPIDERAVWDVKLAAILAKGWPASRIIINAGYYNTARWTQGYRDIVGVNIKVAKDYGFVCMNSIDAMIQANLTVPQLDGDGVHPNPTGHITIAIDNIKHIRP